MFDLHNLRQFMAVAEERHFGRAARRLHMAQPPLSQAIKKLENNLGVMLFQRTKRKVELTIAGEALYREAKVLLAMTDRTVQLTHQAALGNQGRISIAFVSAALYQLLPESLRIFRQQYPDAEMDLQEMTTNQQLSALQDGSIDVGFGHPPLELNGDLTILTLSRDPLIAAIPDDHHLMSQNELKYSDMAFEPFVLFPASQGPSLHAAIDRACYSCGARLNVVAEAARIHTQLSLVAAGLGVTLVPGSATTISVKGVSYRTINDLPDNLFLEVAALFYQSKHRELFEKFINIITNNRRSTD